MGKTLSRLYRRSKRRRVYIAQEKEEKEWKANEEEENVIKGENGEKYPYIPLYKPIEYEGTAQKLIFIKERVGKHLDYVKKEAQQAIIDATVVSTRKNIYGNKIAKTDMVPNKYILKSMLSRSSQEQQEEYIKQNEREILIQVGMIQTIHGYHHDELVDDHAILHEHEAYLSSMQYLLVSPTDNNDLLIQESRRHSFGSGTINS